MDLLVASHCTGTMEVNVAITNVVVVEVLVRRPTRRNLPGPDSEGQGAAQSAHSQHFITTCMRARGLNKHDNVQYPA